MKSVKMNQVAISIMVITVTLAGAASGATTAPSNECLYLQYILDKAPPGTPINTASLPSVSTTCISDMQLAKNASVFGFPVKFYQSVCSTSCRSFYDLYSSCYTKAQADEFVSRYCGSYSSKYCPVIYNSTAFAGSVSSFFQACSGDVCTPSCQSAMDTLYNTGGCCASGIVNKAMVMCGMDTVAPCPTIFSSPTAPSKECVYLGYATLLSAANLPTVSTTCISTINAMQLASKSGYPDLKYYQSVCSTTCQSFYDLYRSCYNSAQTDVFIGRFCGINAGKYCPAVYNSTSYTNLVSSFQQACSGGGVCTPSCQSAMDNLYNNAGCCVSDNAVNQAMVTCGMDTVAPCPSIFNSAAVAGIGTTVVICAAIVAMWL